MQTILLTGANGNLGQAVTSTLLSKGYAMEVATGRSAADMPAHENFSPTPVDLLDAAAAASFVQNAISRNKNLSAGILLVGGFAEGDIASTDAAALDKMIALNFKTAWNVALPLYQHFAENGGGQLIFVGTRSVLEPATAQNLVAYTLSKSLLFQLAEIINQSGKAQGVTATMLVPSVIDTPQNRAAMPQEAPSKWVSPEAIAETVAFLLSSAGTQLREPVLKLYNRA